MSHAIARAAAHPIRWMFFAVLAAGSVWITRGTLLYFDAEDIHPFVLEKLPLPLEDVWLAALHVHVIAAAIALPACLALLSHTVMRRFPRAHRIAGRMTGGLVLVALVPSGAYLSFFATGGWPSTLGFLLSGAIAFVAMWRAIATARARDFVQHRRFVLHVVAQMSVAVTSRAMLVAAGLLELAPEPTYVVSLWLPVLASAALAEVIAIRGAKRAPPARGGTMKSLFRYVPVPLLAIGLLSAPAFAAPPAKKAALAAVNKKLVKPLQKHDAKRARFSRVRRPPAEYRARITAKAPETDARGKRFFPYAVDTRYSSKVGSGWGKSEIKGCVYVDDGAVFAERGDKIVAARVLTGKRAKAPPAGTCRAAPRTAQKSVRKVARP